tara:strand:+ start:1237 stop:1959 length:723 start_codon:yes stop_codon:yes gene_type:complete
MFKNKIRFEAPKQYLDLKEEFPQPIKLNIPKWFKKINHDVENFTIKGCMPFLDTLTTGYLLRLPQDFYLKHNFKEGDNYQSKLVPSVSDNHGCNLNTTNFNEIHPTKQFEGSSMGKKNNSFPAYKILNPWTIVTPKGYSCLFLPPMNNVDDRFSIIPGIVDTDTYNLPINFPILLNGDKYPVQDTLLKKGTPYVQVIPYKRESWNMEIKEEKQTVKKIFFYHLTFIQKYKNKFWNKVSWN